MKQYVTHGTGSAQTLSEVQNTNVVVYDTMADAEADIANLAEGQIVATKDTGDELAQPVDIVQTGNLHAVTSNAVAGALSLLDNKKLEWTVNEREIGQIYSLDNLPNGVYLTFSTSLWDTYTIISINLVFKYNGNYFLDKIYDPNNYISIQGSNLKTNLIGFYTLKMLSVGY